MLLDRLRQEEKFKELLAIVKQKETFFYQIQDRILTIKKTIDRNKSILKALASDNEELQQQINDITMGDDVTSSVSKIDELSDLISVNEKKQNAFKVANDKLEMQKEYLLLTEYQNADRELIRAYSNLYEYGREWIAENIFLSEIMEDFNLFFSFFCNPYTPFKFKSDEDKKSGFMQKIKELLIDKVELMPVAELTGYNKLFEVNIGHFENAKRLKELEQILK
ncbi:Uncharacterised protein [Gallibacterium anatis]|uniref:Uncharacterized protein n=1 Tax=Gallibacterium anatis TaxID=750 RepID=A0A377H8K1_9PAST|nr:hypothetical protein [Gallibacterium anatis]KGQ56049.1 hypothetical protein IE01_07280 [Gallibacterium anatis DSM 16844 = F 149]STO38779.1 Uncharacterised protein [Gallibacterium anatis]